MRQHGEKHSGSILGFVLFIFSAALIFVVCVTPHLSFAQTSLDVRGDVGGSGIPGGSIIPGYDSRTCDGTIEGAIRYHSTNACVELCDGSSWACAGGGLSGPAGCADIGDLCADGTVFAGYHPTLHEHLFIPTADQEQPGSPGTFTMNWKNATGTNDISTDSDNDGQINHANRGGSIANFQAFQACEDLSFGGQSDWYLPSRVELYYIWSVHGTIEAGGNITNFQNATYFSSTESNSNTAWGELFTNGDQNFPTKNTGNRVRCVRR